MLGKPGGIAKNTKCRSGYVRSSASNPFDFDTVMSCRFRVTEMARVSSMFLIEKSAKVLECEVRL